MMAIVEPRVYRITNAYILQDFCPLAAAFSDRELQAVRIVMARAFACMGEVLVGPIPIDRDHQMLLRHRTASPL